MDRKAIEELKNSFEGWNDNDEFSRIIGAIEEIPESERNYELTLWLARAYGNLAILGDGQSMGEAEKPDGGLLEKALALLESVFGEGKDDKEWNMRMAYTLFYIGGRESEALPYAKRWAELDPEDENAVGLAEECEKFSGRSDGDGIGVPEMYEEDEMDAIDRHIAENIGAYDNVFHEIISPDIHVDICIVSPRPERDYYTLVTMGMGAHCMDVPKELEEYRLARAELLINLPSCWKLDTESMKDERWYWPIRLLKSTARLPIYEKSWLGWGHTVGLAEGETYADNTGLCGFMLISPGAFGEEAFVCQLPNGEEVNFYQLLPIYKEEMDFKLENGADALLDKLPEECIDVVDPERENILG